MLYEKHIGFWREGKRSRKESYQKMHHMQKIWVETIHCSPLPWLAYRSFLRGTAFHLHRDKFCGTTLCQFCVTWEPQQSILLPFYMCINTCCPPWVKPRVWQLRLSYKHSGDLLAEEDFQQSCWRTMRKPLSSHQWMLRRFQGLVKWSSILRTDKLIGSSSWNEPLGGVVSGRDSWVV